MKEIKRINIDERSQADQDWWSHDLVIKIYDQDWLHDHVENPHDLKLYLKYSFNLSENIYNFWLKSLILFSLSHAMSCILQRHHSLALNRIISLSLKFSWSLSVLSQRNLMLIQQKNIREWKRWYSMRNTEQKLWNYRLF